MNLLNFDWYLFTRYWAALLVAAGVLLILSGKNYPNTRSSFAGILVILAIIGGLVNKTQSTNRFLKENWNWEENDHHERSEESQLFDFKMDDSIQRGELNLKDGAGSFSIGEGTDKLFETYTNPQGFSFNVRTNQKDKKAIVDLSREDVADLTDIGKSVIKLNTRPIWDLKMEIGAGKANFDFSKHKIEQLTVSAGVGKLKIKLGDMYDSTSVKVESGVSSVTVEIPKATGCEIRMDDGINSRDFDNFDKVEDGHYRSSGYENSSKKATIYVNSGVSKVRVKRY